MAKLSDFGGHAHERGRGYTSQVRKGSTSSFRCLDCGRLFYVSRKVVARGHRVACHNCGGTGEETEASLKRRLGIGKKDIPANTGRVPELDKYEYKQHECSVCGKRFRSWVGLLLHCEDNHAGKKT